MDQIEIRPWYAVQVVPTKEAKADKLLREIGLETYFPFIREWTPSPKSKYLADLCKQACLTGYLFARSIPDQIHRINGIAEGRLCRVVTGAGGDPASIPEDGMQLLMLELGPTGRVYRNPPPAQVKQFDGKIGDEVRGAPGSLISGFIWQVTKICGEQVGLRLLNQMQPREISAHYTHVEKALERLA